MRTNLVFAASDFTNRFAQPNTVCGHVNNFHSHYHILWLHKQSCLMFLLLNIHETLTKSRHPIFVHINPKTLTSWLNALNDLRVAVCFPFVCKLAELLVKDLLPHGIDLKSTPCGSKLCLYKASKDF